VFPVYAVPIGLLAGWLLRGRLEGLAQLGFRWPWLAIGGLATQVLLYSGRVDAIVGSAAPFIYVGSTLAVLVAVLRNIRIPGLAIVAAGAISNLAAILANGGYMPADPEAYALAGIEPDAPLTNSVLLPNPALRPLTDIYALPAEWPLANVFSVGDVLIGIGLVVTIALAMRRGRVAPAIPTLPASAPVRSRTSPD
jgi:hypothetical protein